MKKQYLGDSVYAMFLPDVQMIKIYLDNGDGPKNEIFLENDVWIALTRFVKDLSRKEPNNVA